MPEPDVKKKPLLGGDIKLATQDSRQQPRYSKEERAEILAELTTDDDDEDEDD